jgi:hypothetical protein
VSAEEGKPDWVDAVLAEYEAHRSEVISESETQQQTLAWGATAVGLVVAGAFNVWGNRLLVSIAFMGVVPLLCLFVLVQWVGRAAGLLRVGVYLQQLEEALRSAYPAAPANVLVWEKTREESSRQGKWWQANYEWQAYGAIAIFAALAYGSIALGAYRGYKGHGTLVLVLVLVEILLLSGLAARFIHEAATTRHRLRQQLPASPSHG